MTDQSTSDEASRRRGPVADLVVLDMTRYIAGPYCTMLLADAGAQVVKIEPLLGEDTRHLEPFLRTDGELPVSAYFLRMNRNKRSVAVDLKHSKGITFVKDLISKADVLVENFRPGVMNRLGLDDERIAEINPRLVYCSISGFGQSASPNRDRPSYNVVAEYEAAISVRTMPDGKPGAVGPPVGDMFPALHALSAILMAIHQRQTTGLGSRVDISMYDSMLSLNELQISYAELYGEQWNPAAHPFYCPYGVFKASDAGWVCLDVTTTRQWSGFCSAIGRVDLFELPGLATGPQRVAQYEEVIRAPFEQWLSTTPRDAAVQTMVAHGVPSAAVRHPSEVLRSDQAQARNMRLRVSNDEGVGLDIVGNPIRMSGMTENSECRAPELGADTLWAAREIAQLDQTHVDRLVADGVISIGGHE